MVFIHSNVLCYLHLCMYESIIHIKEIQRYQYWIFSTDAPGSVIVKKKTTQNKQNIPFQRKTKVSILANEAPVSPIND